ncbi:M23 family metallopeptidase [Coraliomargarita akajimensis]|uniref:M23 family metallopeptidase n=1 Tax=Coraliomargarita akajimensis TaxID=395922 RepID=UPI00068D10F1|nr:M23 family metallopeptidase [Coraliomargarita akajimensis]
MLSAAVELRWPTPNLAFQKGKPLEAFIQPTASGKLESGLFGCVRNGGHKFHEGIDLYPIKRTQSGEAADPIFSVLPGTVVHVSKVAGYSSYGRYVVVRHDQETPAFHTLYAHLASVADGLRVGMEVQAGTELGIMGRSAAGYSIPKSRAHLHFEMCFHLTDSFQRWYDRQKFGSANRHGNWNGMNLMGVDPLAYYRAVHSGRVRNMVEYLVSIPAVARIRVHSTQIPDFVRNYPSLVTRPYAGRQVVAWDIAFTDFGVPKEWTPRFVEDSIGGRAGDVRILAYSPKTLEAQSCRRVLNVGGQRPTISASTLSTLKKLFGFK